MVLAVLLLAVWGYLEFAESKPAVTPSKSDIVTPSSPSVSPPVDAAKLAEDIAKNMREAPPFKQSPDTGTRDHARLDITEITPVPLANAPPGWSHPYFNVYFKNVGGQCAFGIDEAGAIAVYTKRVTNAEIMKIQDNLLDDRFVETHTSNTFDDSGIMQRELCQGRTLFFSFPEDGPAVPALVKEWPLVEAGTRVVYLILRMRYRDSAMGDDSEGITESCHAYARSSSPLICGRDRSFVRKIVTLR